MLPAKAKEKLAQLLGPRGYLDRPEDLTLYEYDGSVDKARPDIVVFPRTTEDVVAIVKVGQEFGVPIGGPRRWDWLEWRVDRARRRHHHRVCAHEPDARNRSG